MKKRNNRCNRCYTSHKYKGPKVLVSWIQNRCIKCQRFLGKHQLKYCSKCYVERRKEINKKSRKKCYNHYNKYHREYVAKRRLVNADYGR